MLVRVPSLMVVVAVGAFLQLVFSLAGRAAGVVEGRF